MQSYLFQKMVQGWFKEQSSYQEPIEPLNLAKQLRHYSLGGNETGVNPKEYTSCSLRAGGAMDLLLGGCDKTVISLIGRWHSNSMMEYLRQAALPIYKQLSAAMFANSGHRFPTDSLVTVFNFFIRFVL